MIVTGEALCNSTLDDEWIQLLFIAREMGIQPEEIRAFLTQALQRPTD
ncbi:anti-repressor SinI family protein [Effusibacillus lacus]|uniref:Sin domain-containing protein n=1 Tax=Effusibacillus lacus TaxID=1348429 RepID=A0A292YLW3_9BACL|nr:anti-repressor SinI family protein [Effusibacillus lacus]TCS70829.1 anti-repressor SinI [Effusibacillus lacus]GAX89374.1 hypothetical protein EFBL_0992 [Effusibacillus lacus]